MNISHLLKRKGDMLYTVTPRQRLTEAVEQMMGRRIGALLVVDETGAPISIVTERDVMGAVDQHLNALATLTVGEVMAPRLVTCAPEDPVDAVMDLMIDNPTGHLIRHVPVVEAQRALGLVSMADIVKTLLTRTEFENRLLKSYIRNWPAPE